MEGSFNGRAPGRATVLYCFGALSSLYGSIIGFIQGKEAGVTSFCIVFISFGFIIEIPIALNYLVTLILFE
jgi:hypothetical protein